MKEARSSRGNPLRVALVVSLLLAYGAAAPADSANSPAQLRQFIATQVGGIDKLTVPARDEDLPQPRLADGSLDPLFQNTEAKRYLGKLLFHDPARMVRIRPQYGGVPATAGTPSSGTSHLGEFASKAGTQLNIAGGGEGRGYTQEKGTSSRGGAPAPNIFRRCAAPPCYPATHRSRRCRP
jgi:hypothetical protein